MSQGGESSFTVEIQGEERRPGKTRRCSLSAALDAGPSLVVLVVQNPPANARDAGSIPRWGRSHGGGHGNPLQYSCLENPMHRGAWRAAVHGVAQSGRPEYKHH